MSDRAPSVEELERDLQVLRPRLENVADLLAQMGDTEAAALIRPLVENDIVDDIAPEIDRRARTVDDETILLVVHTLRRVAENAEEAGESPVPLADTVRHFQDHHLEDMARAVKVRRPTEGKTVPLTSEGILET